MAVNKRIIVTGEREEHFFPKRLPTGESLEWISLPLLRFERVAVSEETLQKISQGAFDWIVFASPRAVRFFSESLLEANLDLPVETKVACIGKSTREAADLDGYTADFVPETPGTESFIDEFEPFLNPQAASLRVALVQAEKGRADLLDWFKEKGAQACSLPLYRTLPKEQVEPLFTQEFIESAALVLFTSPSSVDAFLSHFKAPMRMAALGSYTKRHLEKLGFGDCPELPAGNFERVGEIL